MVEVCFLPRQPVPLRQVRLLEGSCHWDKTCPPLVRALTAQPGRTGRHHACDHRLKSECSSLLFCRLDFSDTASLRRACCLSERAPGPLCPDADSRGGRTPGALMGEGAGRSPSPAWLPHGQSARSSGAVSDTYVVTQRRPLFLARAACYVRTEYERYSIHTL